MKKKDNTLTKVEFQVMSILWDINHSACAWDIIERWEEPKPAYTTIATYLKMLYERGYVDYFKNKGEGKTHMYVAKVTRAEYTRLTMKEVKKNFFDDSIKSMFSFFVKEENLSADDIRELLQLMEEEDESLEVLGKPSVPKI
jgi:predicted transcriptional regulator